MQCNQGTQITFLFLIRKIIAREPSIGIVRDYSNVVHIGRIFTFTGNPNGAQLRKKCFDDFWTLDHSEKSYLNWF
jgi:hypothetical protein